MWCTWLAGNAECKKIAKNSPSAHHCATLSSHIFTIKACIDNRKKNSLNRKISSTCLQNMVNFQQVLHLGSVTLRHSGSGRQPNFAALKRGCHLYLAGRPSRWALAHILVIFILCCSTFVLIDECVLLLC